MVYENVERIRKSKGVTKTHLAKKLGMTLQGYRHLTSGEVKLDVERLRVISEALNVEISVFFDTKLTDIVTNAS